MTNLPTRTYYIYKITRSDGKEYIGTTDSVCIKNRMCRHRTSARFLGYEFDYEILRSSDNASVFELEGELIRQHNTLHPNGLNVSIDGKGNHLAPAFTTRGFKFSPESRRKMSMSAKKRIRKTGWVPSDATRKRWSDQRRGRFWRSPALNEAQWKSLNDLWLERPDCNLISAGKIVSYERAFAKRYAQDFGLTANGLYNIVANRLKTIRFPGKYPVRNSHTNGIS